MSSRIKLGLLTSAAFGLAVGSAMPASAQEGIPVRPDEIASQTGADVIVITGSRTSTADSPLEAAQPVQVLGAEQMQLQGATSVTDLIDRLPALRASESTAEANGQAATLDLRGMGVDRTLVLVNGRRHVAGVPGSAAVDISSIPASLVERVEVLTGGASAVYGSDAVTGVVNFILKEDFVGTDVDFQFGTSGRGDGQQIYAAVTHGMEFDSGRGNLTLSGQFSKREEVLYGDRPWSANGRVAADLPNPDLYFQADDGVPLEWVGRSILLGNGSPRFSGTSSGLIQQAQSATPRAFGNYPNFHISSTYGLIGISPYGFFPDGAPTAPYALASDPDIDGNGVNDCSENTVGRGTPGWVAGCWVVDPITGQVRPFQDGILAGGQNSFGGDGAAYTFNNQTLTPEEQSLHLNATGNYDFSDTMKGYVEVKMSHSESKVRTPYQTFDDSTPIFLDNPFIPDAMLPLIDAELAAQPWTEDSMMLTLVRDHVDIWDPVDRYERQTYRAVAGIKGDITPTLSYDVSLNFGATDQKTVFPMRLEDRFYAAIDAVTDPDTGEAVCRSTLDPSALPYYSYLYDTANYPDTIPFTTFDPTSGDCQPLNLFGLNQNSAEALAFQNYYATNRAFIRQYVASATLSGDSSDFFSLPGGPIAFAVGAEYRKEMSNFKTDPYEQAGYGFQAAVDLGAKGEFDVSEAFTEINLPLLAGLPFVDELTVNGAFRYADYSTIGSAETWKVDLVWAPIRDIRFRGGVATTIRAPNIAELYSPLSSTTFRPDDPCDQALVGLGSQYREANCRADLGLGSGAYTFSDPLTARFLGEAGGNEDLQAETAESKTIGVVFRPSFLPGFYATVDYWNIEIEDAIAAVSAQDIVDNCYDAPTLNNPFCELFTRNRNTSDQAGIQGDHRG